MSSECRTSAPQSVDLTNCDREPIHLLGHVQFFGCLISVAPDWTVHHASRNVQAFFGREAEELIGQPLLSFFREAAVHEIRTRLQMLYGPDAVGRVYALQLVEDDPRLFDVAVHLSGRAVVLECELAEDQRRTDYASYVRPMIERMRDVASIEDLCATAARHLKILTGFDRVMVYRFAGDASGEVIAESRKGSMEPYHGLRYPASDIPAQARELYRRNLLRIISDIDAEASPILQPSGTDEKPLDLSLSSLRAVSPIHLQYLRNMGVRASMSISILKRGELWGLFACHHETPRVLSYQLRSATELFAQLFAFLLDQKEGDLARDEADRARRLHDEIMARLAQGASIDDNFEVIAEAIPAVIPCDGIVGWIDGTFRAKGETPTLAEFQQLAGLLDASGDGKTFATDCLQAVHAPAEAYADRVAGILALPMSREPRDYVVLCRSELARTVTWAGNPQKAAGPGTNGLSLTPRTSFAAWQEIVRGRSAPWTSGEIRAADTLRVTLLEVVLRMSDAANKERARAQESQELLIAELNHRVRNILNLIRGLITQSSTDAVSVAQFTEVVGGRIHALARAHDQITRQNWTPGSLRQLIEAEISAYLSGKASRVDIEGADVLLAPAAFTTLSLVMHEMVTNSAKYGALSGEQGHVAITLGQDADGALTIAWRETGGPPVKAPMRRGFGSTIVEHSIPFELKGKAELRMPPAGVEADFLVPGDYLAEARPHATPAGNPQRLVAGPAPMLSGAVLILEDNMIIALDAEDVVTRLGAERVLLASSVADAHKLLDTTEIAFALLDVNLGHETSEAIALRLQRQNRPFAFATGYGESSSLRQKFPDVPIIKKPYDADAILAALATCNGSSPKT